MARPGAKRILVIFGTRPETVKMAPLIKALEGNPDRFSVITCATGQHRELLDEMLRAFDIRPTFDLGLMQPGQTLQDLTARAMRRISEILAEVRPAFTLVQGDTTTAMTAALASFYARIPVGHVEAGLRTADRFNPFPEEINRRIIGTLADVHFAPTRSAALALLSEGVAARDVFVTGNTVIDALRMAAARIPEAGSGPRAGPAKYILVTAHRRESFGAPIRRICRALREIVARHQDVGVVYPVHPNPEIRGPVHEMLHGVDRVRLIEPLGYLEFVACLRDAHLVVTDSGGVQEEAPALGKPVLVVRETTERPEAVDAGVAKLVGTSVRDIVSSVDQLLDDPDLYARMARATDAFGDGQASARIVRALEGRLFDAPCDRSELEVSAA
jgi:UDP-N-acetylglucosamine 2-epimerase (non-hydrolysing)